MGLRDGLAELPVGLSIQLIGFNENIAGPLGGVHKEEVGGDALALLDLDDLSNFHILGLNFLVRTFLG